MAPNSNVLERGFLVTNGNSLHSSVATHLDHTTELPRNDWALRAGHNWGSLPAAVFNTGLTSNSSMVRRRVGINTAHSTTLHWCSRHANLFPLVAFPYRLDAGEGRPRMRPAVTQQALCQAFSLKPLAAISPETHVIPERHLPTPR